MRFKPGADNVLREIDEQKHLGLRKKIASGYAGKENPGLEGEIDERIGDLINLIERKYICTAKETGRQMDFARKAQFLTLDVITTLAFGENLECLVYDEDRFGYIKTVEQQMPVMMLMTELLEVHAFLEKSSLMNLIMPSARDKIGMGRIIGIAKKNVTERFGDDKTIKQDMLGSFLNNGSSQVEAESETVLQILAGSDTTAPEEGLNGGMEFIQPPLKFAICYSGFRAPNTAEGGSYGAFYTPPIARTPVLCVMGSLDGVVDKGRGRALVEAVDGGTVKGGRSQVVIHPGGHFVPSQRLWLDAVVRFTEGCLVEHNKPDEKKEEAE